MFYTIYRTENFELNLNYNEQNTLKADELVSAFLHHFEGNLYYLEIKDENCFDEEAIGEYLKKATKKRTFTVIAEDYNQPLAIWNYEFNTNIFRQI